MTAFPEQSADELYAELVLLRTARADRALVILEGDDDRRFWLSFVDKDRCLLIPAHGKRNVEGCIRFADADALRGVLGIVDADLDPVEGVSISSHNLIRTHDYDLESLLLQSNALDRVLHEHSDPVRVAAFEAQAGHDLRTALLDRALPFARLRWLSRRGAIHLGMERFGPARYIRTDDWWVFRIDALHDHVAAHCSLEVSALHVHLATLPEVRPWAICQGHDLLLVLRLALTGPLKPSRPQKSIPEDQLAGLLRQGFQRHEFEASTLYRDIRDWEARNTPYRVLPAA
jgi:hypothetical protein